MVKVTARQTTCRNRFEAAGYPRSGAAALTGNFAVESGADLPTAFRKTNLDHGSNGLAQWRLERLTNYENYVKGLHPECRNPDGTWNGDKLWPWYGRMDHQVDFVMRELETDYPALNAKLRKGGDPAALAADVCWQYERPNKALSHIADRVAYAKLLAVASSPSALANASAVGVVDHLTAAANTERVKAQGGLVLTALSAVGGAAVVGSNYVDNLPTWEWVAIGVAAAAFVVGLIGHMASTRNARNIEQAVPGVTANAPPSEAVVHAEVPAPVAEPVVQAPADADPYAPSLTDAVKIEVAKQLAALAPAPGAVAAPATAPLGSAELEQHIQAEVVRRVQAQAAARDTATVVTQNQG